MCFIEGVRVFYFEEVHHLGVHFVQYMTVLSIADLGEPVLGRGGSLDLWLFFGLVML